MSQFSQNTINKTNLYVITYSDISSYTALIGVLNLISALNFGAVL